MTDVSTWARVHVLDIAITGYRKRQLEAEAAGSEFMAEFWRDSIERLLDERLVIAEQANGHRS